MGGGSWVQGGPLPATSVDMGPLWVIGIRTPTKGVKTLLITGRGPPCSFKHETSLSVHGGFSIFYMGLLGCLSELGLLNYVRKEFMSWNLISPDISAK